jgi:DNA-binding XRE family transcriptional regulator
MEASSTKASVSVHRLLAKIRAEHGLASDRLAALLGVSTQTLSHWELEHAVVSTDVEGKILSLRRRLDFAGLEAWKFRIRVATRPELLIDRSLTILAVSQPMLLQRTFEDGSEVALHVGYFVGRHVNDVLPTLDCNLVLTRGSGLNELHDIGFFQGRVRCLRICAALHFGSLTREGLGEFWPIETADGGVLAQLTLHPARIKTSAPRQAGVVVHWTQIVSAPQNSGSLGS